jgi:hypothetical protein
MTTYGFCGNNPVSMIDPDGRAFQLLPFLMATLFSGHIGGMINQGNGGSYGKGFLNGAVTSAIGGGITAGIGAGVGALFGNAGSLGGFAFRGALTGAFSGGLTGGISSSINGGNFMDGFGSGFSVGGIIGGSLGLVDGLLSRNQYDFTNSTEPNFTVDSRQNSPSVLSNPFDGNTYDIDKVVKFNDSKWGYLANGLDKDALVNGENWGGIMNNKMEGLVRVFKDGQSGYYANSTVSGFTTQGDGTWWAQGRMNISGREGNWQVMKPDSHGYLGGHPSYTTIGSTSFKLPRYGSVSLEFRAGVNFFSKTGAAVPFIQNLNSVVPISILKRGGLFPFIRKP